MTEQVFVDSLVAINIAISLFLWCFIFLWTLRSDLSRLLRIQTLLLTSVVFAAMIVISLSHASWSVAAETLFWTEILLTLVGGPLYFDFVYGRVKSGSCLHFTMPLVAVVFIGFLLSDRLNFALFLPASFTLAAVGLYSYQKCPVDRNLLIHIFSVAIILHLAQLFRFLGRDIEWFEEIVPFTATILGLTYMAWLLLPRKRKSIKLPSDNAWESVFVTVDSHLKMTEAYRNPNLKLSTLADQLNLRPYLVSQAINQQVGRFNDYINRHRIEAFLSRYNSDQKVEALAHQVGFNSKSAFYRAFRSVTGKTPRELGVSS